MQCILTQLECRGEGFLAFADSAEDYRARQAYLNRAIASYASSSPVGTLITLIVTQLIFFHLSYLIKGRFIMTTNFGKVSIVRVMCTGVSCP